MAAISVFSTVLVRQIQNAPKLIVKLVIFEVNLRLTICLSPRSLLAALLLRFASTIYPPVSSASSSGSSAIGSWPRTAIRDYRRGISVRCPKTGVHSTTPKPSPSLRLLGYLPLRTRPRARAAGVREGSGEETAGRQGTGGA